MKKTTLLQLLSAPLLAAGLLTGCGSTVKVKHLDVATARKIWNQTPEWRKQHAAAMERLKTDGLEKDWKTNPDAVIGKLRKDSDKETELHRTTAVLAAELALKRELSGSSSDSRGLLLVAAEGAYHFVKESPKSLLLADSAEPARFMVNLYNGAVSRFVSLDFAKGELRNGKSSKVEAPGGSFNVSVNNFRPGAVNPAGIDELVPTNLMKVDGFTSTAKLPGVGATFAAVIKRTPEREKEMAFTTKRGLSVPLTTALIFKQHPVTQNDARVDVSFIDPVVRREVPFGNRAIPVSRDCVSPLALEFNGLSGTRLGLGGFMRVENGMKFAGLYMLQPYDPNRIPVLFIHGLQSSPLIWRDLIAELQADPDLSSRYQFWVFYYPSGIAIPYSRAILVDKIEAVRKHFDPAGRDLASRNMVVVGHSMGGVLSRSLITDVGDRFWKQFSDTDFEKAKMAPDMREEIRKKVFFKPLPQVKRAIFVAAPHRGAAMAQGWLGRLGSMLVSLPKDILTLQGRLFTENVSILKPEHRARRSANSIGSLKPDAPIFAALNSSPFVKGVPYHSIIGDRGKGNTPDSSDGIVAYKSSHLDGASSELIVPTGHGAYESPLAIEEVKRILRLHLRK